MITNWFATSPYSICIIYLLLLTKLFITQYESMSVALGHTTVNTNFIIWSKEKSQISKNTPPIVGIAKILAAIRIIQSANFILIDLFFASFLGCK